MSIKFEIINKIDILKSEWNELIYNIDTPEIFFTYEWVSAVEKNYQYLRENEICLLIGREQSKLVAIFPFCIKDKTVTFITSEITDFNAVYINKECGKYRAIETAIDFLLDHQAVSKFFLSNMRGNEEVFILEHILRKKGFSAFLEECSICPYFDIEKDWNKVSNKRKQDVRRCERKLIKDYDCEFLTTSSFDTEIWEFILKHKKQKFGDVDLDSEENRRFFEDISVSLKNNFRIHEIRLNGALAAVHVGFVDERKIFVYVSAFDRKYAEYGIGIVLFHYIMNENPDKIFDALKGDEEYKFSWCPHVQMSFHLLAYKNNSKGVFPIIIMKMKNNKALRRILGR